MLAQLRSSLTYANVVGTLALFVALGGTSYAVATGSIDSREIKNNTIRGKDIRTGTVKSGDVGDGSLTGADLNETRLGTVPQAATAGFAANAGALDGIDSAAFLRQVVYRTAKTAPLNQGAFGKMTVGCRSGERLIGGGAGFPFAGMGEPSYTEYTQLSASAPGIAFGNPDFHLARAIREGETPNVWYAGGYQAEVNPRALQVYAICASP